MKNHIAVIILAAAGFVATSAFGEGNCATEQCSNAYKITGLPEDVLSFVDNRDGCDHFRGEPTDFDEAYIKQDVIRGRQEQKERADFVNQNIAELCKGTDARLRSLKTRYAANPSVLKLLHTYQQKIERSKNRK